MQYHSTVKICPIKPFLFISAQIWKTRQSYVNNCSFFVSHSHEKSLWSLQHITASTPRFKKSVSAWTCMLKSPYKCLNKQEAFEKCWAHSPLRATVTLPFTRCRYCHTPAIAIVQAACDVHDNDDNAWQRGPLWPHGMGPINLQQTFISVWKSLNRWIDKSTHTLTRTRGLDESRPV